MTIAAGNTSSDTPGHIRERARGIRLAAFDVDGTLTDGRLWFDDKGIESKAYHVQDGLGLRLLVDSGITVALITARESASVRARGKDLRLEHVFTAVSDKLDCLRGLCAQLGLSLSQVAYMGDDLADASVFPEVGLAVSPANGHDWIRDRVHWITRLRGGEGAARELCDLLLVENGLRASAIARFGVQ